MDIDKLTDLLDKLYEVAESFKYILNNYNGFHVENFPDKKIVSIYSEEDSASIAALLGGTTQQFNSHGILYHDIIWQNNPNSNRAYLFINQLDDFGIKYLEGIVNDLSNIYDKTTVKILDTSNVGEPLILLHILDPNISKRDVKDFIAAHKDCKCVDDPVTKGFDSMYKFDLIYKNVPIYLEIMT